MDDAIRRTLTDTARFLEEHSVSFAVIGGIAVSVRGEPRFTADVDAVVGLELTGALALLEATEGSPFTPLFPDAEDVVRTSLILPLRHRQTRIKVDLAIGLTGFERQLIGRAEETDIGNVRVPIATAEDLLLMKVLASRPRDTEDAERIVLRQGRRLDWDYVLKTARELEEAVAHDLVSPLLALRRRLPEKDA